ncbi:MAG: gamma carbonic anhydrase family protein [Thermoplasmatales archaeon]|nr:gamma carbonic anhydrase family protein [Thermoplasmatales archaeon]MCW6170025.1 gamma carbonic anhydrase family protein [Thermoplasmatales archaeon]
MSIKIGRDCFIADSAVLIGDVEIGDRVAIMDGAVIRGDLAKITIGNDTNVQDNVTIHCDENDPTIIGNNVSIGHNAVVHGCIIGDNVLLGMGSVVMNRANIADGSVVGGGALVTEGFKCSAESLIVGVPSKVIRSNDKKLLQYATENARSYGELRKGYISGKFEKLYGYQMRKNESVK